MVKRFVAPSGRGMTVARWETMNQLSTHMYIYISIYVYIIYTFFLNIYAVSNIYKHHARMLIYKALRGLLCIQKCTIIYMYSIDMIQ